MNDLIDRQAAIDAIERNACNTQRMIDAVKQLPSAQPKTGWWIELDDTNGEEKYLCSNCGASHYGVDRNYCPNCGARMMKGE